MPDAASDEDPSEGGGRFVGLVLKQEQASHVEEQRPFELIR